MDEYNEYEIIKEFCFSYEYGDALSYVRQNGVMCHGVVVSGSRDVIERLATNPTVQYIAIDDVMVSAFSREQNANTQGAV